MISLLGITQLPFGFITAQSKVISQKPLISGSTTTTVLTMPDQKAIDENFKLVNPTEKTDISKQFRISGYGVPGAAVEIHITPISVGGEQKFLPVPRGQQNPYEVQHYTVTINDKGSWSMSDAVKIAFKDGATQRRVHVFAAQSKKGLKMKKPVLREIKLKDELQFVVIKSGLLTDEKVKNDFKVLVKSGNHITSGSIDMQVAPVGTEPFRMQGMGAPKSKLIIDVSYSGTETVYKKVAKVLGVPAYVEKQEKTVKNKKLGSFEKNIGEDGKWDVLPIDPYVPKTGDVGTTLIMTQLVIHFKVFNGNKEVTRKSVTLSVVPGLNTVFFQ